MTQLGKSLPQLQLIDMAIDVIKDAFPVSFLLGLEAIFLAAALGITVGAVAAMYRGRWQDRMAMTMAALGDFNAQFSDRNIFAELLAFKFRNFSVARWGVDTIYRPLALAARRVHRPADAEYDDRGFGARVRADGAQQGAF